MFEISIRADVKKIERSLSELAYKQLPFATAQAMTSIAKLVAQAEIKNMSEVLDKPTPFTLRSVGVRAARKDTQQAIVYVRDIAAAYLEPYEFGGMNKLNGRALLEPVNARVNQYGNLPKSTLSRLKARGDVFIGPIKTKVGMINGVWQRIPAKPGKPSSLKLLIRFEDAHPVKQRLGWQTLAQKVVSANLNRELGKSLARAIATARG